MFDFTEPRSKPFGLLLSPELQIQSGFRDDPSLLIHRGGRMYRVFLTYVDQPEDGLNLVVIEDPRHRKDGLHRDWYFGIIHGQDIAHRSGDQVDDFLLQVHGIVNRKNRIAGKELEEKILSAVTY